MTARTSLSTLIILFCVASAGLGQGCGETRIGWQSDFTALSASGELAVFGDGELLIIADLQDPAAPSILGSLQLDDRIVDLAVEDDLVCAVVGSTILQIIDISEPSQPSLASSLQIGDSLWRVVIVGSHAAVGDGARAIRIIDVSDPAHPDQVGLWSPSENGRFTRLARTTDESIVYVIEEIHPSTVNEDESGVWGALSIADPERPEYVWEQSVQGQYSSLVVHGDRAYVTEYWEPYCFVYPDPCHYRQALRIYDISQASRPERVKSWQSGWQDTSTIDRWTLLAAGDSLALMGNRLVELKDSPFPYSVAQIKGPIYGAAFTESYIYLASGPLGLRAYSLDDHDMSQLFGAELLERVAISETQIVVDTTTSGVYLLDAADPDLQHPSHIIAANANDVAVNHRWALAVGDDGLYAVELAAGSSFSQSYLAEAAGDRIAVTDRLAVVSDSSLGLRIVDISDHAPTMAGTYASESEILGVAASDHLAVVTSPGELKVIDLSDPALPVEVGQVSIGSQHAGEIAMAGDIVYAGGLFGKLNVFDISDPTAPVQLNVDCHDFNGISSVAVAGKLLCVSTEDQIWLYDISDPEYLREILTSEAPTTVTDLAAEGATLVVSAGQAGLQLIDVANCIFAADFSWSPANPTVHDLLRFDNSSTGGATTWHWDLGDGATSDSHSPSHRYTTPGSKQVGLTISDGSDTATVTRSIEVAPLAALGELDQDRGHRYLIPSVAHAEGVDDTIWISNLELHNPSAEQIHADLYLLEAAADNRSAQPFPILVPAGQSLTQTDAVTSLFGVPAGSGAVFIVAEDRLVIGSRTTTGDDSGTYGQRIPAFVELAAPHGTDPTYLIYLSENARYRSNLGLVNLTGDYQIIDVEIFAADGDLLGSRTYSLKPFSYKLKSSIIGKLTSAEVDDAFAVIRAGSVEAAYFAFASVIDRDTNDPMFVAPVATSSSALVIPVVVEASGANQTEWKSDLELLNPGAEAADVRIELLATNGCDSAVTSTAVVNPGTSQRLTGVLEQLLANTGQGALLLTPETGTLAATSRAYNDLGSATFGQLVPAVAASSDFGPDATVRLIQLAHSTDPGQGFRTNLGFVNLGDQNLDLQLSLYAGDGTLLRNRYLQLGPCEHAQENNIFRNLTINLGSAFAEVISTTSDASYFVYASVIDNGSGDPMYVAGEPPAPPP